MNMEDVDIVLKTAKSHSDEYRKARVKKKVMGGAEYKVNYALQFIKDRNKAIIELLTHYDLNEIEKIRLRAEQMGMEPILSILSQNQRGF